MLDLKMLNNALTFLEEEHDVICIQVMTVATLYNVKKYINNLPINIFKNILESFNDTFITEKGRIIVECADSPVAGLAHDCPTFLVEEFEGGNDNGAFDDRIDQAYNEVYG